VADIFDEVEEDLRAERARQFARRYAGVGVAALLLVLGAIAGWQGWQAWQARRDRAVAAVYLDAMRQAESAGGAARTPTYEGAISGFAKVAAEAPPGYRALARLQEAALRAGAGDAAGAAALWNAVAADDAVDPLLRDAATLLWAEHQVDAGDAAAVRARLAPLTGPANPWHGLAQETGALLDLREGHDAEARQALQGLARDITAPQGVRSRADGLLARLGG